MMVSGGCGDAAQGEFDTALRFDFRPATHQCHLTLAGDLRANLDLRNLKLSDSVGAILEYFIDLMEKNVHVTLEHGDADALHHSAGKLATDATLRPFSLDGTFD